MTPQCKIYYSYKNKYALIFSLRGTFFMKHICNNLAEKVNCENIRLHIEFTGIQLNYLPSRRLQEKFFRRKLGIYKNQIIFYFYIVKLLYNIELAN